jgi:hypothetical protein
MPNVKNNWPKAYNHASVRRNPIEIPDYLCCPQCIYLQDELIAKGAMLARRIDPFNVQFYR